MTLRRSRRRLGAWWSALALVVATSGLAACGSSGAKSEPVPDGQRVAIDAGCSSCHGVKFTGGAGPSWVGLTGSTVTLADGSTVVADRAYLVESIRDPAAKRVAGFNIVMPRNALTDEQIGQIVDYIQQLGAQPKP